MANIDLKVVQKLDAINWLYADKDPNARRELEKRIAETGKNYGLISYSGLVEGIDFNLPIISPNPYHIRTYDWQGLDRAIIGDFLGFLNKESYTKYGFFSSALVIGKDDSKPSPIFFEWMQHLGILSNLHQNTVLEFWVEEVKKAHGFFNGKPI